VINNVIEGAGGADDIQVLGNASVTVGVFGAGNGNDGSAASDLGDTIVINTTGTVEGVWGGDDQNANDGISGDRITWTAGTINDGIYGGNGSDWLTVTAAQYNGQQILDGGDDASSADGMVDVLTINGITATANAGSIRNWEIVNLDNTNIIIPDLVAETVNVCNGSTTLSGNSNVDDVLGCVSPDQIIVTDNTVINNVIEGAGGSDDLQVLGNASVTNGVFGAGQGQDNTNALDDGDTILINTTGTIEGVWGGDDQNAADGVTGDTMTWTAGTINDGIYGENGSDTLLVTAAQYTGTQTLNGGDDVATADGMIDTVTIQGLTVAATGANIVNWENVIVDNTTLSFTDDLLVTGSDPGTGLTITNGGLVDGGSTVDITGNMTIDPNSTFQGFGGGAGVYNISGSVVNTGTITTLDGTAGDTVNVGGDYSGGGQFLVDANFNTTTSDKLVIGGDVIGPDVTDITVTDVTTGVATGADVLVVDVVGNLPTDLFVLTNGPLLNGVFSYDLEQKGTQEFLTAVFRPIVPPIETIPQIIKDIGAPPSLEQRIGNRQWMFSRQTNEPAYVYCKDASKGFRCKVSDKQAEVYASNNNVNNLGPVDFRDGEIWGRVEGSHKHVETSQKIRIGSAPRSTGADYESNTVGMQVGVDKFLSEVEDGVLIGGVNAGYSKTFSGIKSIFGNGDSETISYAVGGTLTWYHKAGSYFDLQSEARWYDIDVSSNIVGSLKNGVDAFGFMFSGETGHKFVLDDAWSFTPSLQLSYMRAVMEGFTEKTAGLYAERSIVETLLLRAGGSLGHEYSWKEEDGTTSHSKISVGAGLTKDFMSKTSIIIAGTKLWSDHDDFIGDINLAATYSWDDSRHNIYGQLAATSGFDSIGDTRGVRGTIGYRLQW